MSSSGWWWGFFQDNGLRIPNDDGFGAALTALDGAWSALSVAEQKAANAAPGATDGQTPQQVEVISDQDRLEMAFPLADAARAEERAEALVAHLTRFANYYNYAILTALPPSALLDLLDPGLTSQNLPVGTYEPRVVAMRGSRVAVPLTGTLSPALTNLIADIAAELAEMNISATRITLPTPGFLMDSRLGICDATEREIRDLRQAQVREATARALQAELEANRMQRRLDAGNLDAPTPAPASLALRIEEVPPP
jgi:hypothetical protein